jgi:uncharacterized membrane protein
MKKLIQFTLLFVAVLLTTFTVFAQTDTTGTGGGTGSADPLELIFLSVATLAGVVLPITGWIATHVVKGSAQITSWVVAVGLASLGHVFNLGIFGSYNWFWTIGYGMIAALTANGMADTSMIQAILKAIAAKGKF